MTMSKGVFPMMPIISWISFTTWFALLIVVLFVAGLGALVAVLLARQSRPPSQPPRRP